ncbi:MAG: LysR family transcriptional regulator [Polyangiaceae bacterium]
MVNLSNVDLNLFLVLHTVIAEGSATRAAQKLHVTQSAVSNALARLRAVLGDPLVTRTPSGLVPTPKAAQLAPLVARALDELQQAVNLDVVFDPAETTRRFTLACSDYEEVVVLPAIVERLEATMPNAQIRAVTIDYLIAGNGLGNGDIDVLVGMPPSVPPGCVAEELFEDEIVAVVRRGHPHAKKSMSLAELVAYPHIHTAVVGNGHRWLDDLLAARGLARRVILTVPHLTIGAMSAARTNWVLPFPRRMANALASAFGLDVKAVGELKEGRRMATSLVWHARTDADPGARAFREVVRAAATTLGGLNPRRHR